ncbi:response regulator [uncultured Bacteroides sp.]|uniref:hybrid sensor histidine kinase/response regulator transcription factor n=1 Tax=uncultured Bacteroides sp. TaxID=162156 RepID=UPI002605B154|nr:response regulator [uncultured Bacteroides sp.]
MKVFLLTCLISILPCLLSGKDSATFFRCYYDELNLPQTTILNIDQDSRGYIWLATGRGVYRFDGNEVIALSEILPDFRDILEIYTPWVMVYDKDKLWISNGYIYDLKSGDLYRNPISYERTFNMPLIDSLGNLWFNYYDRFARYDVKTERMSLLEAPVSIGFSQSDHYIWGVIEDKQLVRMSIGEGNIAYIKYDIPSTISDINNLYAVNDNTILVGTKSKGLWIYDVNSNSFRQIIKENYIRDIMCYDPSTFWIGTENGIYIYNIDEDKVYHWEKDPHDIYAIQDHAIYSFFKDREGGVWCGSYFRGLSYVPNVQCKFNSYKPSKKYPGLEGTVIREFCKDNEGNLWIGTEDYGVSRFIYSENRFENYSKGNGLNNNNIHGLCCDDGILWCGSFDNGIELFDIKKKKVVYSFSSDDNKSNLKSDFVFSILKTNTGDIWIATDKGVQVYEKENKRFSDLYEEIRPCSQLYQDSRSNIWAVCTNELACISPDNKLTKYALNTGTIQSVMETTNHEIWVATSLGISRLDESRNCFINHVISEQSVSTNFAYRIVEDGQGYFWISTAYGLVRYHPKTHASYVFTTLEGLPENRFNVSSSFKDDNGIIHFGTINGFTCFDPTLFLPSNIVPKPQLSKLMCMGVNMERTIYNADEGVYDINYTENTLSFDFSSLTYTAPGALRYRYRLDPIDRGWHVQNGNASFTYPSLLPGKYKVRFQTTDYNGEWVDNEISYNIEIIPPFYLSWWAKTIYMVVAFAIFIFSLHKWHERINSKQKEHIKEIKDATEKEIYKTKINFFTTIVHEIRTPLTLIKAPLDKELSLNRSENLLLVEKNVDRLQNLCTQLLDFRKMESEQLQLNFVKTNLSDLLKGILYRFSAQIKENNLDCEDNLDNIAIEAPIDREAFTKIVSNMLNNAVKYSSHIIKIELGIDGDNFYLSVRNDGVIIDKSDRAKVFNMFYRTANAESKTGTGIGLAFCRSLAEMHNGSLELIDDMDYTNFRLTLPLKQQMVFSIESVTDEEDNDLILAETSDESKVNILVVEDEPELRNFLKKTLSEKYNVFVASNGISAMGIIEKYPVSVVITDVMMPRMDGCELCRVIKNRIELCGIPVVMLTAKNTVEARLEGYMAGAEEYIEKPFSMRYLLARIDLIIDKKRKDAEKHFSSQVSVKIDELVNKSDSMLVDKFQKLVEENISSDKLNITFLCEQLGMSQTTFFRKMKALLNVSPNDYIRIARIEHAATVLLKVDNVRISDVAYEFGFSSPSYFTRCFIQHYGMSPKDYIAQKKTSDNN